MKEKLEQQIREIAELPERIIRNQGLDTTGLVQHTEKIKKLTTHLQDQIGNLNFELFTEVMGNKIYDAQIYYDDKKTFEWDKSWGKDKPEWSFFIEPITELKIFFENPDYSSERKRKVEEIIIFAVFLQTTYDFYKLLELYPETDLCHKPKKPLYNPDNIAHLTSLVSGRYFELLDNLSYKCNPTVYKLLSALNHIALCLVLASLIILPLAVPCIIFGSPLWGILFLTFLALAVFFVPPALTSICRICDSTIDARWGTNWAYRLPDHAIDMFPTLGNDNPYEIGIFPSLFGYPRIPAGASFKAMNRLGVFPFEKMANEAIAVAETVLETNAGKTSVDLSNRFRS